jgi:ketosteroid isomerase-like protein
MSRKVIPMIPSQAYGGSNTRTVAWVSLVTLLIVGCSQMSGKVDTAAEKAKIEKVVKNSIQWVLTKDTALSYGSFYRDTSLFWFSPDNAGTNEGFDDLKQLTEQVFMDPRFKGVKSDFKQMRINLSHSGECAWWSCYLDDFNEWDGRPANWENVRWTGVLEKMDGAWKIRQMHFSYATEDMQREIQKAVDSVKAGK